MPSTPRLRPIAVRIELLDVAPLIWRRVLVSNQWTLTSLHNYLQWVMGGGLPPVRTEREWLMAGLVGQAQGKRARKGDDALGNR